MLDVLWPDAEIESLTFDYDRVRLMVREPTGRVVSVDAHGPVGLEVDGFWDEIIVADADLVENHPFAERCWDSVTSRTTDDPPPSGSPDRNMRSFLTLVVTLVDGCHVRIAAARFTSAREDMEGT
jgi:hypothetical protein